MPTFGSGRGRGGGAKKGHAFFGNQHTKIAKYSRKKGRVKRAVGKGKRLAIKALASLGDAAWALSDAKSTLIRAKWASRVAVANSRAETSVLLGRPLRTKRR